MAGGNVTALRASGITLQTAVDDFIASKRCENPNTRRAYAGVLDRLLAELGADRPLTEVSDDD